LGREERLKSRTLIERVFRQGKSFSVFPFRVSYILNGNNMPGAKDNPAFIDPALPNTKVVSAPAKYPRLQTGFGASRRNFKRAVDRNRIKRLIREAWRLNKPDLQHHLETTNGTLVVFIIYTGKELPDYQTVNEKILVILQKLIKVTAAS
jgi:ribonuclease P protein component